MAKDKGVLTVQEYKKAKSIWLKTNQVTNDNIYTFFVPIQIKQLQKYYKEYSIQLFQTLVGTLMLKNSAKMPKLAALKGKSTWEFNGFVDMQERGAGECALGHKLRYVYMAKNKDTGAILKFGSTCVGDFFDMGVKEVAALTKLKDIVLDELKTLAAIQGANLWREHFQYDYSESGLGKYLIQLYWLKTGGQANDYIALSNNLVKNLKGVDAKNLTTILKFDKLNMPIPPSLIAKTIENMFNITPLVILQCFPWYEHLSNLQQTPILAISSTCKAVENRFVKEQLNKYISLSSAYHCCRFEFYAQIAIELTKWQNRSAKLQTIHTKYKDFLLSVTWYELLDFVRRNENYRSDTLLVDSLTLLTLFDMENTQGYLTGNIFKTKEIETTPQLISNFDKLLDIISALNYLTTLNSIVLEVKHLKDLEQQEKDKQADILAFLRENLPKEQYNLFHSIAGVRDIILNRGLTFDTMTTPQRNYVMSVYERMSRNNMNDVSVIENAEASPVNMVLQLKDYPDILGKIHKMQTLPAGIISADVLLLMQAVVKYKELSELQLQKINREYDAKVLKQLASNAPLSMSNGQSAFQGDNKKYALVDRPDVREWAECITIFYKDNPVPANRETALSIATSVLRYKTVSDKQAFCLQSAYRSIKG